MLYKKCENKLNLQQFDVIYVGVERESASWERNTKFWV